MTTLFVGSPAFDQVHFAKHRVARTDVLIEARRLEGESLPDRFFRLGGGPFQL